MKSRIIPVYLPRTKVTIMVPKLLAKLTFELNYKGLATTRVEVNDDEAMIELENYDLFRRNMKKWQLSSEPADKNMWTFLKANVAIELNLMDVSPAANPTLLEHPYTPILRCNTSKIDEFSAHFYASQFGK